MMLEILAQTTVNTPLPIEMVFTDGNMSNNTHLHATLK